MLAVINRTAYWLSSTEPCFNRNITGREKCLPYLAVLVGDMITEEALPTYMNMLNTLEGTKDKTGADDTAWGKWTRQWTAEENRHGGGAAQVERSTLRFRV
jgi:hypothetical protein